MRVARSEIINQLSESLGQEKATDAVDKTMEQLGMAASSELDKQQTLSLLEALAASSGLVGIVARFAKVRIILRFK